MGRAGNGLDALQLVEELQPDLLLTDIQTAVNEFVTKAIVSGITDDDWNEFMNICASLQVDEYCSIYQKGLDNLLNK